MPTLKIDGSAVRAILPVALACFFWLWILDGDVRAGGPVHPLAPPDTSSPRATLKTFRDNVDGAVHAYKAGKHEEAKKLATRATGCLNLEQEPPALRYVLGFYDTLYLKETLDRIELPPGGEIPDTEAVRKEKITSWTVPYTEITIALSKQESATQRFLFTSDTVKNAEKYYNIVKHLPYTSQSGGGALFNEIRDSGSLILSKGFVDRFPGWSKREFYGEALWQWIGLVLYCFVAAGIVLILFTCGRGAFGFLDKQNSWNLKHTFGGLVLPAALILVSKVGLWLIVYGLHFLNADVYVPIAFVFLFISYGGQIWLIGAVLNRVAMLFVHLSGFVQGGVDEQLVRIGFQIVTVIIVGVMIVNLGARLGLPTYSLITGLGIGGLAVALAGREALSNIIGTVMIILDRPFSLGDYIVLGDGQRGAVTQVGLRSTRIRTRDDILISIPNSVIANAKMINESAPVSMSRIRVGVGVGYGSDLKILEQTLLDVAGQNPAVLPDPAPRIRFRRFGDSALDFELLCWIALPGLRGRTTHELNWAINEAFRKQGIEIPFPQRDIHIRHSVEREGMTAQDDFSDSPERNGPRKVDT